MLLDLKLPGMGGLSAIPQIQEVAADSKIVVFTMYDNPAFVWETVNLRRGGLSAEDRIQGGIAPGDSCRRQRRRLPAGRGDDAGAAACRARCRSSASRRSLTQRELQILEALAEGLPNKTIAHQLALSEETIKSHLRSMYEKLGAADRAHAVSIALRQRLIE